MGKSFTIPKRRCLIFFKLKTDLQLQKYQDFPKKVLACVDKNVKYFKYNSVLTDFFYWSIYLSAGYLL